MQQLEPHHYVKARAIFHGLHHHLAVSSVVEGRTQGIIYVDDFALPRTALCQCKNRFYLAGEPNHAAFIDELKALFSNVIYPQALAEGRSAYTLYHDDKEGWPDQIRYVLEGRFPVEMSRNYYTLTASAQAHQFPIPSDMSIARIDAILLGNTTLGGYEDLIEELLSERESVNDFLERSFGFCMVAGNNIVGMCTSEFNTDTRAELGINTMGDYRRKGVASALVSAFVQDAFTNNVTEIGWHCWGHNAPSIATATRCGFQFVGSHPAYFAYFNTVDNLAMNGETAFMKGEYQAAVTWYERAFALGSAKAWAHYFAAQAYAALGHDDQALDYLEQTAAGDWRQLEDMEEVDHFARLHDNRRWIALIEKLKTEQHID